METFIGIRNFLRIPGFLKFEHPNAKIKKAINICQKIVLFCGSPLFILSPLWFFFFRAETFYEKAFSFGFSISIFFVIINYGILTWRREQILDLLTQFESKIIERKNCYEIKKLE